MRRSLLAFLLVPLMLVACGQTSAPPEPTVPPPTSSPAAPPSPAPTEMTEDGPPPEGLSSIVGLLWEDRCDPAAPATCQTAGAGIAGNGLREPDEPGIEGIRVELASGACPGAALAETLTDGDGRFEFGGLEPGAYCLSVDPSAAENASVLGEGQWTLPHPLTLDLQSAGPSSAELAWEPSSLPAPTANCTDAAAFYGDVTIPDDTAFRPGDTFVKTWRLRNSGTCTWGSGYTLQFAKGQLMGGPDSQPLPASVSPGQTVEVSVDLTAPSVAGVHQGDWWLRNSAGVPFGVGNKATDFFWVRIQVTWVTGSGEIVPGPAAGGQTPSSACPTEANTGFEEQVLQLINAERAKQGLPALVADARLAAAARGHSADMGCHGLTGHIGSDGSNWYGRITAQGYPYASAYENVYFGTVSFGATPQGAVTWWMNSKVHRDNILNPKVTEIGVGYALHIASGYGYYTVVFANR